MTAAQGRDAENALSISVVVTTYNRAALLRRTLDSIARAARDVRRVEAIVVDNNSADDTPAVVEDRRAGFPCRLAYVVERAQGLSHARNRGLRESRGEYIVFVDDDQTMDRHYLERLPGIFRETAAACVGGPILYDNLDSAPARIRSLCRAHGEHSLDGQVRVLGADGDRLWGGNMAFDRRELAAAGGFDVRLGHSGGTLMGGEDFELQARLHRAGKRVVYHSGLIQYHHLESDRFRRSYWRKRYLGYGRSQYTQHRWRWDGSRRLLNVPYGLWRQLVRRDVARYLRSLVTFNGSRIFQHELYLWRQAGRILEARSAARGDRKTARAADEVR